MEARLVYCAHIPAFLDFVFSNHFSILVTSLTLFSLHTGGFKSRIGQDRSSSSTCWFELEVISKVFFGEVRTHNRSFSICPSVPCFLTPEPPAELWWHFTSATCTDSSLILLRANLSWRDAIVAQNSASDCGATEEGQLTDRLAHFSHLSFSAFPNLFRSLCGKEECCLFENLPFLL